MARKPGKSETLTIRLDPKTRFMLEFVARLRGQTITVVVERAIAAAADGAEVPQYNAFGGSEDPATWRDYWDVSEGVRAMKMAADPELHPTYDEERRLAFAKKHAVFFFALPSKMQGYRVGYIDTLWPQIDRLVEIDEANRATDYFAAGREMVSILEAANLKPPIWPPEPEKPAAPAASSGMDDDVPF